MCLAPSPNPLASLEGKFSLTNQVFNSLYALECIQWVKAGMNDPRISP